MRQVKRIKMTPETIYYMVGTKRETLAGFPSVLDPFTDEALADPGVLDTILSDERLIKNEEFVGMVLGTMAEEYPRLLSATVVDEKVLGAMAKETPGTLDDVLDMLDEEADGILSTLEGEELGEDDFAEEEELIELAGELAGLEDSLAIVNLELKEVFEEILGPTEIDMLGIRDWMRTKYEAAKAKARAVAEAARRKWAAAKAYAIRKAQAAKRRIAEAKRAAVAKAKAIKTRIAAIAVAKARWASEKIRRAKAKIASAKARVAERIRAKAGAIKAKAKAKARTVAEKMRIKAAEWKARQMARIKAIKEKAARIKERAKSVGGKIVDKIKKVPGIAKAAIQKAATYVKKVGAITGARIREWIPAFSVRAAIAEDIPEAIPEEEIPEYPIPEEEEIPIPEYPPEPEMPIEPEHIPGGEWGYDEDTGMYEWTPEEEGVWQYDQDEKKWDWTPPEEAEVILPWEPGMTEDEYKESYDEHGLPLPSPENMPKTPDEAPAETLLPWEPGMTEDEYKESYDEHGLPLPEEMPEPPPKTKISKEEVEAKEKPPVPPYMIQFPPLLPGMPVPPAIPALPGMEKVPPPPGFKVIDATGKVVIAGPELPKMPTLPTPQGIPVPGVG